MKWFLAALLLLFVLVPAPAYAVCGDGASVCYLRNTASGNWVTTTNWSTLAGGTLTPCTCAPATGDSVVLDSASASGTTISTGFTMVISGLDFSGTAAGLSGSPFAGTLSQAAATNLTLGGSAAATLKFSAGMTYTLTNAATSALAYTGTNVLSVTSAGKTFGNFNVNGVGGTVRTLDTMTLGPTAGITLTNGTLDFKTNANNASVGSIALAAGTKTLLVGCTTGPCANTLSISGAAGTVLDLSTNNTGLTFTDTNGNWNFNGVATGTRQINVPAPLALANVTLTGCAACGASRFDIQGGPTFTSLAVATPPMWVEIASGTTLTVTNAFNIAGTSGNPLQVTSDSAAGNAAAQALIHATAPSTIAWASIYSIQGTTSTITATNSFNLGNNTGTIGITAPSGGSSSVGAGFIGGGL